MSIRSVLTTLIFLVLTFVGLLANIVGIAPVEQEFAITEVAAQDEDQASGVFEQVKQVPEYTQEEKNRVLADVTTLRVKEEFFLSIPSIGLNKQVKRNVDPADKRIYGDVIEKYIAHGKYTRLPKGATEDGNVYLFAHREGFIGGRDVGFFRRLDELGKGDRAIINFDGGTYTYKFRESFIVDPLDTYVYTGYSKSPTLTLQTCNNGEEERLIVRFDLVKVS